MRMNDFFVELASRNIGAADVLMPRRAARFETARRQDALSFETKTVRLESFDDESAGERLLPHSELLREHEAERTKLDSETQAAQGLRRVGDEAGSSLRVRGRAPMQHAQESESIGEHANPKSPLSSTSSSSISRHDASQQTLRVADYALIDQDHVIESSNARTSDARGAHAESFEDSNTRGVRNDEALRPETRSPIVATPSVRLIERRIEESSINRPASREVPRQTAAPLSKRLNESSAAPTVNVTIGRLEVRAVTSSAQPARSRAMTTPALSLDEYLRKRRKGGER